MQMFEQMGLTVRSQDKGVYHFTRQDDSGRPVDMVGLMLSTSPMAAHRAHPVKLFLQDVTEGVAAADVVEHWHNLDARRFEETGLQAIELELDEAAIPRQIVEQRITRPDGTRIRHTVQLTSGDVVCYN
ncbi:hypothetical protein KTD31_02270 [Burkholderia multivorans]|jgi:hypothetical protein|uniref:hypothetical protein n=1 Tax=Burkholderia multivorans TaxID=87883 RepID=UPI001C24CB95|nr:hypothetical protein [Burkholderia multivorans]MBU9200231.1 hypothetical protein [Burkholderia multivorans]MDN8078642.1 hypothetical protein [Burkholderia multivorans]